MTLETWLKKVDAQLVGICGLGLEDLPDTCYADYYEDEFTPQEAALQAIEDAGYGDLI